MSVPDFQSFFKPLLDVAADGKEHSMKEAREIIAKKMNIAEADIREMLPSGTQTKYDNRIAWAKSYFVQANVFESLKRGWFRITERGKELHKKGHERIDVKILNQFPEFVEFHTAKPGQDAGNGHSETSTVETPEETLQKAYINIRADLAVEILERIKGNSPEFFERLDVDVMVALGYGGSRTDAGKSIGQVGDEGITGSSRKTDWGWI